MGVKRRAYNHHYERGAGPGKRVRVLNNVRTAARAGSSGGAGRAFRSVASFAGRRMPYVGAAFAAYDGYKAVRSAFSQTPKAKKTAGIRGRYAGKFKRTRQVSKKTNPFIAKGFEHTAEINGQVSDPNCVYVGHSTLSGFQTMEVICQALLRKLFEKAGVIITGIKQPIPGYDSPSSQGWKIVIRRTDKQAGSNQDFEYAIAGQKSIYDLIGSVAEGVTPVFPNMLAVINDFATGANSGSSLNTLVPTLLMLYREESNTTAFWQMQCALNLENEKVHLSSTSTIKIQNRSLDATGSTSTETVSSNPLSGKLYHFSSGIPRAKIPGVTILENMYDAYGVLTARATSLSLVADGFKEPPNPKFFWNCASSSGIKLDPGSMKQDSIHFQRSGYLLKVLKSLFIGVGAGGVNARAVNLSGKSALVALEDMINVSATADITIAYEVNRKFGAYLTTNAQKSAVGTVYQSVLNNP